MSTEDEAFRDVLDDAPAKRLRFRPTEPPTCARCLEAWRSRSNLRLVVNNDAGKPPPPRQGGRRRG